MSRSLNASELTRAHLRSLCEDACCSACADPDSDEPCDSDMGDADAAELEKFQEALEVYGVDGRNPFVSEETDEEDDAFSIWFDVIRHRQVEGLHWTGSGLKRPHVGRTKKFATRDDAEQEIRDVVMAHIARSPDDVYIRGYNNKNEAATALALLGEAASPSPGVLPPDADKLLRKAIPAMLKRVTRQDGWSVVYTRSFSQKKTSDHYIAWDAIIKNERNDKSGSVALGYDIYDEEWTLNVSQDYYTKHADTDESFGWLQGRGETVRDAIKDTDEIDLSSGSESLTRTSLNNRAIIEGRVRHN